MFKFRPQGQPPAPEILIGYWARYISVEYAVKKFLKSHPNSQIVSIGSGFDTLYWRLQESKIFTFIELDFPSVIRRKEGILKRSRLDFNPEIFKMIGCNITEIDKFSAILQENLDPQKPTIILSECVFMYLKFENVDKIFEILFQKLGLEKVVLINYDSLDQKDNFSKNMVLNLKMNQEIDLYLADLENYSHRLEKFGPKSLAFHSMLDCFKNADRYFEFLRDGVEPPDAANPAKNNLPAPNPIQFSDPDFPNESAPKRLKSTTSSSETSRILKILPLDDREIFNQIMEHYFINIASFGVEFEL